MANAYRESSIIDNKKSKDEILLEKVKAHLEKKEAKKKEYHQKALEINLRYAKEIDDIVREIFDLVYSYKESLNISGHTLCAKPYTFLRDAKKIYIGVMWWSNKEDRSIWIDLKDNCANNSSYSGSSDLTFTYQQFNQFLNVFKKATVVLNDNSRRSVRLAKVYLKKIKKQIQKFESSYL